MSTKSSNIVKKSEEKSDLQQNENSSTNFYDEIMDWASQRDAHWIAQTCKPYMLHGKNLTCCIQSAVTKMKK